MLSSAAVKRVQPLRAATGPTHCESLQSGPRHLCVDGTQESRYKCCFADIQLSVWNRNLGDLRVVLCGLPVVLQVVLCGLPVVLQVVLCGLPVVL